MIKPRTVPAAGSRAFTLIEIVIAMTILAVLAAAAIPSLRGVQRERLAREPIVELVRIAKEARLQAIKEQRPYQVVLHSGGFTAMRYFNPYLNFADLQDFTTATDQAVDEPLIPDVDPTANGTNATADNAQGAVADDSPANRPPTAPQLKKKEWMDKYTLPLNTTYSAKFWHETDPTDIQGETIKVWVFQPSGVSEPLHVHLARDNATFDIDFSALSVDIVKEASSLK